MLEYIFVALIIGLVLTLAGRSVYRTMHGDTPACACRPERLRSARPLPDREKGFSRTIGNNPKRNRPAIGSCRMCSAHVLKRQLIVLAGVLLPLCTVLPAEEIYSAPAPEPLKSRLEERSLRRRLAERGVEYEAGYTAEYFGKLRGGLRSRGRGIPRKR